MTAVTRRQQGMLADLGLDITSMTRGHWRLIINEVSPFDVKGAFAVLSLIAMNLDPREIRRIVGCADRCDLCGNCTAKTRLHMLRSCKFPETIPARTLAMILQIIDDGLRYTKA